MTGDPLTTGPVASGDIRTDRRLTPWLGPAAWSGAELADDDGWQLDLTPEMASEVQDACAQARRLGRTLEDLEQRGFELPLTSSILDRALDCVENGRGLAVIRGLPIHGLADEDDAYMYAGVARNLGVSIVQDTLGTKIDRVQDRGLDYNDISVRGYTTSAQLTPHCDSGDVVALLCLRQAASGGENVMSSALSVYNEILERRPDLLDALYRGVHFNIRGNGPPGTFRDLTAHRVPIFSYHEGRLSCRFNEKAMLTSELLPGAPPLTPEEKEAIAEVARLAMEDRHCVTWTLAPGELLLLNNHAVFHNRSAFTDGDRPDQKRMLLRKWINIRNGRPLTRAFADHYNTGSRQGPYVPGEPDQVVDPAAELED
jgi:hypothetical protein